jgi:hypothetical protein
MNSNLLKNLLAVAMTGLFLVSMGVSAVGTNAVAAKAADTKAKCEARGGTWVPTPKPAHCKEAQ